MKSSLPTSGSADSRFWGPRFFRGTIDKPRTPTTGVRATQPVDFQSATRSNWADIQSGVRIQHGERTCEVFTKTPRR